MFACETSPENRPINTATRESVDSKAYIVLEIETPVGGLLIILTFG